MADIKISQLGAAIAVEDTDLVPIVSGGNTLKATAALLKRHAIGDDDISDIGDGTPTGAIAALNTELNTTKQALTTMEVLVLSTGSTQVNSLPYTFSNASIETDMVCLKADLGTPSAQVSDWEVNTDTAGSAVVSGTISGSTTIKLYMMKSR